MEKETKLVKKVKCLLRRLGCPRWLHHYGPKTYEFLEFVNFDDTQFLSIVLQKN